MPNTYESILKGRTTLAGVQFPEEGPNRNSVGAKFLRKIGRFFGRTPPIVVLNCMFNEFLRTRGWRWVPTTSGDSLIAGARLLDGRINSGECGFVANALVYLINAPRPWGFGIDNASCSRYSGENNCGFISEHGSSALPGVQPNIVRPDGNNLRGYYLWNNHKVVEYGHLNYDPCYNKVYHNPNEMADATLTLVRQRVRLRDLSDYDFRNPLKWPKLLGLKISDLYWSNTHRINIYQASGNDSNVTGYYIEWSEEWRTWGGPAGIGHYYGPYRQNPLVR